MTLDQFFTDFYHPLRLRNRSHNTLRLYRRSIELFGESLGRPATLDDLTDDQVCRHLAKLSDPGRKRKLSVYTVDKERAQLIAIWNYAAKKGHVKLFPDVPRDTLPKLTPVAWMPDELQRIIASCQCEAGDIAGVRAADWWVALHLVIWNSGERIGAVLRLTWDSVDGEWLKVNADTRKGKRGDKVFKLGPDTLAALDRIRRPKRDLVFPWPVSLNLIYEHYGRILRRAGLPADSKSKFHRIRRSVASHFKATGGDATDLLDHADARTTKKYLDPRIVQTEHACDVLFGIMPGQSTESRQKRPETRPVQTHEPIEPEGRTVLPDGVVLSPEMSLIEYATVFGTSGKVSLHWGAQVIRAAQLVEGWMGRRVAMCELSQTLVDGWLAFLERTGTTESMVTWRRSAIKSLWQHGQADGIATGASVHGRYIRQRNNAVST
jgi:integrase